MIFKAIEFKKGDIIRVHCGSIYHYGIYVSDDEVIQFGPTPVKEIISDLDKKICTCSIADFSCGLMVETAVLNWKEKLKRNSVNKSIEIARSKINEGGYNIIHNNCEHFVNYCVFNVKYSAQEQQAREKWHHRDYLDVFISKVDYHKEITTTKVKDRDQQISKTKDENLKQQRYCLFDLLDKAIKFSRKYDIEDLNLKLKKDGSYQSDKCKLSFSHNKDYLFIAISNKNVGVDVESLRRNDDFNVNKIATKIITDGEEVTDNYSFIKLWTAKEAIFKAGYAKKFVPNMINTNSYLAKSYSFENDNNIFTVVCDNIKVLRIYSYQNNKFTLITKENLLD